MDEIRYLVLGLILHLIVISESRVIVPRDLSDDRLFINEGLPVVLNPLEKDKKFNLKPPIRNPPPEDDDFNLYDYEGVNDHHSPPLDSEYNEFDRDINKVDNNLPGTKPERFPFDANDEELEDKPLGKDNRDKPSDDDDDLKKPFGNEDKPILKNDDEEIDDIDAKEADEDYGNKEHKPEDGEKPSEERKDEEEENPEPEDKEKPDNKSKDEDEDHKPEDKEKPDEDEDHKPEDKEKPDEDNEDEEKKQEPEDVEKTDEEKKEEEEIDETKDDDNDDDDENVPDNEDDNSVDKNIHEGEEAGFLGGGSIFDTPFFNVEQVKKYFSKLDRALGHVFRQTLDEANLLNGTYANTTEEEVEIDGKKYIVTKSVIKGSDNHSSLYVESLSTKGNDTEVIKDIEIRNVSHT